MPVTKNTGVVGLIKCKYQVIGDGNKEYAVLAPPQVTGLLYVINNFLSGHIRMRARPNGSYPYGYLDMFTYIFGENTNTIEVCSGTVKSSKYVTTVDINPTKHPDIVDDAQILS
jgi:hypothetical protein